MLFEKIVSHRISSKPRENLRKDSQPHIRVSLILLFFIIYKVNCICIVFLHLNNNYHLFLHACSRSWKMAKDGTHQFSKSCDFDGAEVEGIEEMKITGKARTAECGKVCRLLNVIICTFGKYLTYCLLCIQACKANAKCAYFALDKSSSTCFLKRANGFTLSTNRKDFACGFIPKRQQFKMEMLTIQVTK